MTYVNRSFAATAVVLLVAGGLGIIVRSSPAVAGDVRPFMEAFGMTACSSPSPCIKGTNSGTGPGVEGISSKGKGIVGQTKFNSTSPTNGQPGVFGQDLSTSGSFNQGVLGSSSFGIGVSGTTVRGSAVSGIASSNGIGVIGQGLEGVVGQGQNSSSSVSVLADGKTGLLFRGVNTSGQPQTVFSVDPAGNTAISGTTTLTGMLSSANGAAFSGTLSTNGQFVSSSLVSGNATVNSLSAFASSTIFGGASPSTPVLALQETAGPTDILQAFNGNFADVFRVDDVGDVQITGLIFTAGGCSSGCMKAPDLPGRHVLSYAPRESLPTMEDVGEAKLVNGRAMVSLDASYANVIDRKASYLVFITPEGMVGGTLCVTDRTPHGFVVQESGNGRSTVPFAYRIVAKPYGETAARLPMVDLKPTLRRARVLHARSDV